jgi:ABC-type Na+ efflux pump permease subunit
MSIWTLARKDLRVLLRDTRAAIILLSMPLIFILVLGMIVGEPDDKLRITIVDEDEGLPPNPGPFPGRKWSEVVKEDLGQTAGIRVEVLTRGEAEKLIDRHKRSAILVFSKYFSKKVHHCSFLDDRFLDDKPGVNPFYRDGVNLNEVGLEVLEDPKQALGASIIKQVAQVSLLRVVMPWMIGKAFDKISEKQFIDEMSDRVEVTSFGKNKFKPLKVLSVSQRGEVGAGVQESLQEMFSKYDLRAKTWAAMTKQDTKPDGGSQVPQSDGGFLHRGTLRYQILVPSYTVMFAFFLVLTVGWLFVAERRQGTLLRLRAAPLSRGQILAGKLLPCFVLSLVQGFFLLAAGWVIFGMNWGPKPLLLVPVVVSTSLAAVGLSLLVASIARTETQVSIYGSLLVLILGGVSGCLLPWDQMPETMQFVSQFTPHSWALDAYQTMLTTASVSTVLADCGVLTLFGFGFLGLSWVTLRLD